MGEFFDAAVRYPTVLFTIPVVAMAGFWLLVLFGATTCRVFDGDVDTDAMALGRVPVAVAASCLVVISWSATLLGSLLIAYTEGPLLLMRALAALLPAVSLFLAWKATRALMRPLAKLFPDEPGADRRPHAARSRRAA
ncbi:hypothetical protein [Streptomyces sp. NBC_01304]|uniref:hypothetical protein n=1 Tax=Streptomyces sp. NBC_01304 TaxID=2903818 RepID=UPI002E10A142|nr:hypothetical protein OG430_23260 [Streptomyces sp. NBC_01304]